MAAAWLVRAQPWSDTWLLIPRITAETTTVASWQQLSSNRLWRPSLQCNWSVPQLTR